jgi:nickel/cobalt transporter (NicO) family protein
MAEIPTFVAMSSIDGNGDGTATSAERQAWAGRQAPMILGRLSLAVDGHRVGLTLASDSMRFRDGQAGLPILYFSATFEGVIPRTGSVEYADSNYGDRIGWKEITARSTSGVSLAGSSVPAASVSDQLRSYPVDMLASPLDVHRAGFSFHPGPGTAAGPTRSSGPRASGAPIGSGGSFTALVGWKLTPLVLALSLLLAFGFGTLHALGPGHGKTITAAYLVGSGARRRQALVIGGAVSVMHTASVLALGVVAFVLARSFPAERAYPWLTLLTGLVALGLGFGLLVARIRSRRLGQDPWSHGHEHPWDDEVPLHGHDHSRASPVSGVAVHGEGHALDHEGGHDGLGRADGAVLVLERPKAPPGSPDHPSPPPPAAPTGPVTRRGLLALALAGGILPSPTALVVLTGAIYAHRVGYGLALIFAFSLGLAAALMGIGLLAIRVRTAVSHRLRGGLAGLIPILSAAVVVGFGVFFASRGLFELLS